MAINKPRIADSKPIIPEITNTFCNLSERSSAVDAGVINIATTRITPTVPKEATTAKESINIKK